MGQTQLLRKFDLLGFSRLQEIAQSFALWQDMDMYGGQQQNKIFRNSATKKVSNLFKKHVTPPNIELRKLIWLRKEQN